MARSYPLRSGSSLCGFTAVGLQFKWGGSFSVLSTWGCRLETGLGITLSCGMRGTAIKGHVLESTAGTEFARVEFLAHTLWKGQKWPGLGFFIPCIILWRFWCYVNGLIPKFPHYPVPGKFLWICLTQIAELLVVITPVSRLISNISDNFTIFKQSRNL